MLSRSIHSHIRSKTSAPDRDHLISVADSDIRGEGTVSVFAQLLMRQILATPQSFFTATHGLDEAALVVELALHHLLHKLIALTSLPGGRLRKFRFDFGCEMHCRF